MAAPPHVYTTEAIPLRRPDYGEADRILTLFTPAYGKVRAIAKGARRTTSRLAGHLEPFTRTQLLLATGRELDIITQAEARERLDALREDLWHATGAWYIAEMVDRFLEDADPHPRLYRLFAATLRLLDDSAAAIAAVAHSGKNGNLTLAPASAGASGGRPPASGEESPVSGKNANHPPASVVGALPAAPVAVGASGWTPAASPATSSVPSHSWLVLRYFELHLLDELGYRPALHT